jgi:hypothetical protein
MPDHENESQLNPNDNGPCKTGNYLERWLFYYAISVLAAGMGNTTIENIVNIS